MTGKLWEIADIAALIEAKEGEKPAVRATYKKQVHQLTDAAARMRAVPKPRRSLAAVFGSAARYN